MQCLLPHHLDLPPTTSPLGCKVQLCNTPSSSHVFFALAEGQLVRPGQPKGSDPPVRTVAGYCVRRRCPWAWRAPRLIPASTSLWCLLGHCRQPDDKNIKWELMVVVGFSSLTIMSNLEYISFHILEYIKISRRNSKNTDPLVAISASDSVGEPPKSACVHFPGDSYACQGLRITGVWGEAYAMG